MTAARNRQILLAARPHGEPTPEDFRLVEAAVLEPGPGQMLLRTVYLSLDPYMRGRMDAGPSYAPPVEVGAVMEGRAVSEVVRSNLPEHRAGDIVFAGTGWQEYALSDGPGARKVDPALDPISYALGVFGVPGLTAYAGLLNIGNPQPGETVVVAAASGAVGSVVGQIARIKGCRVVGIAGGERKCCFAREELGFDACLDHRQPDLAERLKAACPQGIDVYFENMGGAVFDTVLPLLNNFARVPVWPHRPLQRDRVAPRAGPRAAAAAQHPGQAADLPGVHRLGLRLPVAPVPGRRGRLTAGGAAEVPRGHHRRAGERPAGADRPAAGRELSRNANPTSGRQQLRRVFHDAQAIRAVSAPVVGGCG
jgi:NADPH-dependent curcumin reductase